MKEKLWNEQTKIEFKLYMLSGITAGIIVISTLSIVKIILSISKSISVLNITLGEGMSWFMSTWILM